MAEKKRPSVAEILATARKLDAGRRDNGDSAATNAAPVDEVAEASANPAEATVIESPAEEQPVAAEAPAPAAKPTAPKPQAKPAASAKGGRLSVAEMMAAARAQKPGEGAAPAKPAPAAKPSAAKPAAAKAPAAAANTAAEKRSPKAPAAKASAAAPAAPKSTASILAAARTAEKPGPISKAEAATKPQPAREAAAAAKAKLTVPPMPPKPAYAVAKPKVEKPVEDRRGFMSLLFGSFLGLGFTSLAVTTGLWTLGTARFMFPNILTEPPSRFKVGFKDALSPGQVETKYVAQFGVWVVNYEYKGQKQIFALRTVCTHLGCTPNWLEGEQKFKCPCHGSGFYKDGVNFEGPAPRPLERYAIRVGDDGQLEVDKSKTFHEELGQWADQSSFVLV
jgi:cytochrome b6-f complex iron-sulfur subunit